jgi:hypothetical protein
MKKIEVKFLDKLVGYTSDNGKTIDFLDNEAARQVKEELTKGTTIGISSRQAGTLNENNTVESENVNQYSIINYTAVKNKIDELEIENALINKIFDELYSQYETEHNMQSALYIHPMFYNGTYSENNECQPPDPGLLLSKEDFIQKINEDIGSKWEFGFQVLFSYLSKQK